MTARCAGLCAVVAMTGLLVGQEPAAGPRLDDLMQRQQSAEMLRAVRLTDEQLQALAQLQDRWAEGQNVPPDVGGALADVCVQIAQGAKPDEAMATLGEFGREIQQNQERVRHLEQDIVQQLQDALSAEQRQALVLMQSPVRGLGGLVDVVTRLRQAPPEAWAQTRPHLLQNLLQAARNGGKAEITEQVIGEWLDQAHGMQDDEFAKAAPGLAEKWARALMPDMMRQFDAQPFREARLADICRRLIADPATGALVTDVLAARAKAQPARPAK